MGEKLRNLGEFGLIDRLCKSLRPGKAIVGIGDDTAVLPLDSKKYLLLTTDMIAQGRHFLRTDDPQAIGHKVLACNISDIAAMGGIPTYAVVSIGLPSGLSVAYVQNIYEGINRLAKTFDVAVVGGDTISHEKVIINIALLGEVEKKYLVLRSGARTGDWIFVTGALGRSFSTGKHLNFTPRVDQARFLVKNFKPNAMMDISDGLAGDLGHILKASGVGARLIEEAIPRTKGASVSRALTDGEDFELLFTLPAAKARKLLDWQATRKRWFFYPIGEVTGVANRLEVVKKNGAVVGIRKQGFKHF